MYRLFSFFQIKVQYTHCKSERSARHWWLMPVILATQEAEIRFEGRPRQRVLETLCRKYPRHKRSGRVALVVEHLPSTHEALSLRL
jgi:hypothetical protein